MSKLKFESARHEISHFVHGSRDPLSTRQLLPMCELVEDEKHLSNYLYNMCQAGQLTRHPAPEGSGMGVKWVYGPGKVKLGAADPENDAGGGDRSARQHPDTKSRKARAVKPHKTLRKTAPKSARVTHPQSSAARWALTSDGAFLLLDTNTEIPQPAARALVEFVRRLDAGAA